MSVPWYVGHVYMFGQNGYDSPFPPAPGDPSWTWDVEMVPSSNPIYATSSIDELSGFGWFSVLGGILQYRTRNQNGQDTVHDLTWAAEDGLADFVYDTNVDSITFAWEIDAFDDFADCRINFQIWGDD